MDLSLHCIHSTCVYWHLRCLVKLFHQFLHSWWLQCWQCTSHCRPGWRWPLAGHWWWWRDELSQDPPEWQCSCQQEPLHHSVGSPTELQQWYYQDQSELWKYLRFEEGTASLKVRGKYKHISDMNYMLTYLQCLGMLCFVVKQSGQSTLSLFQVTQWWWEIVWMSYWGFVQFEWC